MACSHVSHADSCSQMRRFERIGLTGNQAEALTNHVTELICLNKEKISEQFVSKAALERVRLCCSRVCLYQCVIQGTFVFLDGWGRRYPWQRGGSQAMKMCVRQWRTPSSSVRGVPCVWGCWWS